MQSNNPMFQRVKVASSTEPMTVNGAVNKAVLMTGFSAAVAFAFLCTA